MKNKYAAEVRAALEKVKNQHPGLITEEDLRPLPLIVQKYLNSSGVIGMENILNARIEMEGKIRSNPGDSWMKLSSVQYNFFDPYTRIFYIKAKKMCIPAVGLHLYKDETALMLIKLAGLFTISDARGPEMDQGETVTVFNDMCFMAPGTLLSKNIRWEILEPTVVNAIFTNGRLKISARLYFDEGGRLINFVSNDRFETKDGKVYKNYPWSTPVTEFGDINGRIIPAAARAIYHHPEGEFCYAEFFIKDIKYNCNELF